MWVFHFFTKIFLNNIFFLILLSSCSNFYYHPTSKIYLTPDKLGKKYIDFSFTNTDGEKISSWKILGKNGPQKNLIIQFHGNAENMTSHMASLIWLTDYHYDLITFDYPGYGMSEGIPTPLGIRNDSITFLNKVFKEFKNGKYNKLILVGQSLGGAILMDALSFVNKNDLIDLLVLDSTFSSYKSVGMKVLQKSWITYLFSPLSYLIATDRTAPTDRLNTLRMPKLIIHSRKDPVVDFSEGEKLHNNLPHPKTLWSFNTPSHIGIFFIENKKYRQKFLTFIKEKQVD